MKMLLLNWKIFLNYSYWTYLKSQKFLYHYKIPNLKNSSLKIFLIKIWRSFNYKLSFPKIWMVLIPLFLFFIYNNKIINFIEKYLIIDPPFLNFWLDLIIILISLILISRLIRNFIKYKYLASFLEVYIYSSICFLVTYFYVKNDDLQWTFLLDSIFKIN